MVHISPPQLSLMKTFGRLSRGKKFNHRVPLRFQRFQDSVDPDEIVKYHSRDDFHKLDRRAGQRTYKDAQQTIGRKHVILPNLNAQDLEANHLFQQEYDRQRSNIARVNKIRVIVDSLPGKGTELSMNQYLSTPYECALHIHDLLTTRSVVAELVPLDAHGLVNVGSDENTSTEQQTNHSAGPAQQLYWDMHRPIEESCRIRFRHFTDNDLTEINKIYWRSCSFVLGMAIRMAFKDNIKVLLHSWPKPNLKSGSFVYDVALNLSEKWMPDEKELRAFTKVMWAIKSASLPFERLQVTKEVARDLFAKNPLKLAQIDSIAESNSNQGKVTVYRCGGLLDMSIGPMISNTSQIGRITLAAVHPFESTSAEYDGIFYRFQGVSLPQQLPVSSFIYQNILINQAKKLNKEAL